MARIALARAPARQSLADRLAGLSQARRERLADAGAGLMLAVINVMSLLAYRDQLHPAWLALLLVAAQGVPLIWRRSRPIAVMIVIGAARVAYDRIGFGFAPFPLGPAIAFYTVIDRCSPPWRWITVAASAAGLTISLTSPGDRSEPYQAIFQALIFLTAWVAGTISRGNRASLQAARSRAERAEAELDREAARAAAGERVRIARELHDVVAHHVSLIAVQAEAAASQLAGGPPQARRSADIIGQAARQALAELRRLLGVLRGPGEQPQTRPAASLRDLGAVIDQVRAAGLAAELQVRGTESALPPGVDLTAYRIVQEALTNALRHSGAARARVTVTYERAFVTVSVTDSGPDGRAGPPPGAGPDSAGFGLAGIAERVASCGGSLTVGPVPAGGFAVSARLPVR